MSSDMPPRRSNNMPNLIILVALPWLAMIASATLCGCDESASGSAPAPQPSRMVVVDHRTLGQAHLHVVRDDKTGDEYLVMQTWAYQGGVAICPMTKTNQ